MEWRERVRRAGRRADQEVLEGAVVLVGALAVVGSAVPAVAALVEDRLAVPVPLADGGDPLGSSGRYAVRAAEEASLLVADATWGERLAVAAPSAVLAVAVAVAAWQVLRVARGLRHPAQEDGPFGPGSGRRLGVAAVVLAVGWLLGSFLRSLGVLDLAMAAEEAFDRGGGGLVTGGVTLSFVPLVAALALAGVAALLERGEAVRRELAGLV